MLKELNVFGLSNNLQQLSWAAVTLINDVVECCYIEKRNTFAHIFLRFYFLERVLHILTEKF